MTSTDVHMISPGTRGNVQQTIEAGLCVSCGMCLGVCSQGAITWQYKNGQYQPVIADNCSNCGKCATVCPGINVDLCEFIRHIDANYPVKLDELIRGNCLGCYVGYSQNEAVRQSGTSGGVLTQLMVNALDNGFEGCFVAGAIDRVNRHYKLMFTNCESGLRATAGSKYLPVSAEDILFTLRSNQRAKIIVVGTPCQFYGLKRAMAKEGLSDKNVYFLGLFCDRTMSQEFLRFIERKYGKGQEITGFEYRSKTQRGWPGNMLAVFNSRRVGINRRVRMALKEVFGLKRCGLCFDKFNTLADIAFGDCYIKRFRDKLGMSNIIVRTKKGKKLLDECNSGINLTEIDPDEIFQSQSASLKKAAFVVGREIYDNAQLVDSRGVNQEMLAKAQKSYQLMQGGNVSDTMANKTILRKRIQRITASILRCVKLVTQQANNE